MNFNNLQTSNNYVQSRASRAVKYSAQSEYAGNNLKEFYREQEEKENKLVHYRHKHGRSKEEKDQETKMLE